MIITVTLEKEDFFYLHDVIFNSLEISANKKRIQKVWDNLPDMIKSTAIQWGTSDTVFGDHMYNEIMNNKEKYKSLLK